MGGPELSQYSASVQMLEALLRVSGAKLQNFWLTHLSNYKYPIFYLCLFHLLCLNIHLQHNMMTKGLVIGLLLLTYTLAATYMTFDEFIQKFNKKYTKGTEEYIQKEKIYNTNIQELIKKNCAECGVTKFFDISQSQFNKRQLNLELPTTKVSASMQDAGLPLQKVGAPNSIDWRDRGVITRPKDQGQCGCCWSFATCALAQSNLIMKGLADRSIDLSEQYLLKCTPDGDCEGGYIQNALKQIYTYGAPLESKYPYNPYQSSPGICLGTSNIKVTAKRPQSFYDLSTEDIKNLLTLGPLAIAIDSTNWEYYTGGTWKCNPKQEVNHAVLLVGYTADGRWIIKNQWGEDWGENGYMYVSMDPRYNCNIGTALHMLYAQYFQAISLALLLVLGLLL